jgi:uncharacterized protein (DUF488 family)
VKLLTIGVYGFSGAAFFKKLRGAGVDTFCDIRWRRGLRGSEYAFANSAQLRRRLARMKIRYVHLRQLAPSPAIRQRQEKVDRAQRIAKRRRSRLSDSFIRAYQKEVLSPFRAPDFLKQLGPGARNVALFCVERDPAACHRSLLAEYLEQQLGVSIEHLLPE